MNELLSPIIQSDRTSERPGLMPKSHPKEQERLAALREYKILDTEPEQNFDDLTLIASQICGTPMALISIVDADRQWFKSRVGVNITETPRDLAFCAHAILEESELFVVEDAAADPRFSGNPLVAEAPHIRFYAGARFRSSNGLPLGTLCVIDRAPRQLTSGQRSALAALSRQVEHQLELRINLIELRQALAAREEAEQVKAELTRELKRSYNKTKRISQFLSMSAACRLSMVIPADINAITPVVDGVLEVARQMKSAEGREFEVETAVREAMANAIKHGCKGDSTKKIECVVACDQGGEILLVVRDPGADFDPLAVPDPTKPENLLSGHGRGLYMINEMMDDVEVIVKKAEFTQVMMKTAPK